MSQRERPQPTDVTTSPNASADASDASPVVDDAPENGSTADSLATPPIAPREPHVWQRPTGDVDDDFAWMRDVDDTRLVDYLTAENAYADAWFAPRDGLVTEIFDEIRSRVQETDMSTPVENGRWWYVTTTLEGESYPRHHRGRDAATATDVLLLDENHEADGHDYFDLGAFDASHDHTQFAWSIDTSGDERYLMRIRRVDDDGSQHDLDDVITDAANAGVAWSADGTQLFYVRPDDQERPYQVWRHSVGEPDSTDDTLVFQESDERFFVQVGETRSDRWIVIHSGSQTSSEVRLIPRPANRLKPPFRQ